jgi:hypothetical protein
MGILRVLTELTALSSNSVTILKPFRPWFGIPLWRGRTVGIRLLNAGEIEQALEYVNDASIAAQDQALKKEIVARCLWTIDGAYVAPKEEVEQYNKDHKTELSDIEYRRIFVQDFEQFLVDYLYTIYTELQQKQTRKVMGISMCAICKTTTPHIPSNARKIKFNTAEYLCADCLTNITDDDGFDFEDQIPVDTPKKENKPEPEVPQPSDTVKTPADFETLEDYRNYLIDLAEKNGELQQKNEKSTSTI